MPLDKISLKSDIENVYRSVYNGELTSTQESEISAIADGIANAVDKFVKGATINVQTITTCPSGAGTGQGSGSIS